MPLTTCPDCGREVSDLAPACPLCARPFRDGTHAPAPSPETAASPGGRSGVLWFLALGVGICAIALTTLAARPTPASEEATSEALLSVGTIGFWEDVHYRTRGEYGSLWDLQQTNADAARLEYGDPKRDAEVFRSIDNKAVLVVARDLGKRIECATYRRNGEMTATPDGATDWMSKIDDMQGWPRDLGSIDCRRAGFPWRASLGRDRVRVGRRSQGHDRPVALTRGVPTRGKQRLLTSYMPDSSIPPWVGHTLSMRAAS